MVVFVDDTLRRPARKASFMSFCNYLKLAGSWMEIAARIWDLACDRD